MIIRSIFDCKEYLSRSIDFVFDIQVECFHFPSGMELLNGLNICFRYPVQQLNTISTHASNGKFKPCFYSLLIPATIIRDQTMMNPVASVCFIRNTCPTYHPQCVGFMHQIHPPRLSRAASIASNKSSLTSSLTCCVDDKMDKASYQSLWDCRNNSEVNIKSAVKSSNRSTSLDFTPAAFNSNALDAGNDFLGSIIFNVRDL